MNTTIETLVNSDFIILLGEPLFLNEALQTAIQNSTAYIAYMNPIDYKSDALKFSQYIKYEVGSEEGICALLLEYFAKNASAEVEAFIDDMDVGYLSAESSVGEEEFEDMVENSLNKTNKTILLSEDLFVHKNASNIKKLLGALNAYSDLNCVILSENSAKSIEAYNDEALQEVEELMSFNGTVIYKNRFASNNELVGSQSFSKIAKVDDGADVVIKYANETINRKFRIDTNLQGTVALCDNNSDLASLEYSYKQVKIEKVDA